MNQHTLTAVLILAACRMVPLPIPAPACMAAQAIPVAQSDEDVEYGVKAAFIYNFMKFIEWPADKKTEADNEQGPNSPMLIGIVGHNPFGEAFEPVLGKTIHDRAIQLVHIESYQGYIRQHGNTEAAKTAYRTQYQDAIRRCDILFICQSEQKSVNDLLAITHSHAVLTVADMPNFAKIGGMIGFVKENNKVRFEINLKTVTQEQIKVRSQLLGLARKIYKEDD